MINHTRDGLGEKIRTIRKGRGESLAATAQAISTDRAYLNKIELGKIRPSERLLDNIIDHFAVEANLAATLKQLAGHVPHDVAVVDTEGIHNMASQFPVAPAPAQRVAQITVNPQQTPVLYTDSIIVGSSEFGLVLDVAQSVGNGTQQTVVARIGMSFEHAKRLLTNINDHIEKNER
jgi:DNA-binding XRE family transcriptional regulator